MIFLIHKYLNAGVIEKHSFKETEVEVAGGPLSPLLSNILLNEFDKEMEERRNPCIVMRIMQYCYSKVRAA